MPIIMMVGNKRDKDHEREVERFDAETVRNLTESDTPLHDILLYCRQLLAWRSSTKKLVH